MRNLITHRATTAINRGNDDRFYRVFHPVSGLPNVPRFAPYRLRIAGPARHKGRRSSNLQLVFDREDLKVRHFLAFVALNCLIVTAQVHAQSGPPFPRLSGYLIGGAHNYQDRTYQAQIARLNWAVIEAWPGWTGYPPSGSSLQQAVQQIKALNPGIRIFNYDRIESLGLAEGAQTYPTLLAQVNAMNWWVYVTGTSGARVSSAYSGGGGPFYEANITNFAPPDSNGDLYTDVYAKWAVATYVVPNPALDGLYTDNVGWVPWTTSDGDWNRAGPTDSTQTAAGAAQVSLWLGQGYQRFFGDLRNLKPGITLVGNIGTWGRSTSPVLTAPWNELLQGGVIEGIVGQSWSPENWAGWAATLAWYRKAMAATAAPQLVEFHQLDVAGNYQGMRYGLATCLMDNGYYEFSTDYHTINWFDEYNTSLGQATSAPPTAAWQKGVWRRDFQNGIALVNPKGNGPQTVTLETAYKKINGTQVPSINNGQTVTTVTLLDRDGLILLRLNPPASSTPAVPMAPTGVTATH
jgi:hypothetical protein